MAELIERLIWWLTYCPGQEIPVPRELAGRVIAEWAHMKYGPPPQPADADADGSATAVMSWKLVWTARIGEVCWPDAFDTERDAHVAVNMLARLGGHVAHVEPMRDELKHGAPPRPADAEGTSPDASLPGG